MSEGKYNATDQTVSDGGRMELQIDANGKLKVATTGSSADNALIGAVNETAPATDTASSGLNGRLQRIAQRITSLIALVPASLGSKAAASSFAVTQSTEDAAQLGSLTETAPATDTASSGLNGRLQRIAQRITSLIGLFPAALGAAGGVKVSAAGLEYETVAASQSAQVLGGTGATGDYLAFVNVQPTSTAPGVVTILDNATEVHAYPGGTVGADLKPWTIPIYALSVSGAWKMTTGANVKCTAFGDFAP